MVTRFIRMCNIANSVVMGAGAAKHSAVSADQQSMPIAGGR